MARKTAPKKVTAKRAATKRKAKKHASKKKAPRKAVPGGAFTAREAGGAFAPADSQVHVYGKGQTCDTNSRGFATPENRSPAELVLDSSEGFIPLWAQNVTLRWRFNESSMRYFQNPTAAKGAIRQLLGEALLAWGDAAPVKFRESQDAWDFEIVMREADKCNINGCTLASAFFPDPGRHELVLYPILFTEDREEQTETFVHEIGHIFGLRHFFANISETEWPSVIFGTHQAFSIMNYGHNSELTPEDKSDLKLLYRKVWSRELEEVNGTRIALVEPYHELSTLKCRVPVGI